MGKGSIRRPPAVSDKEVERNWKQVFRKPKAKAKRGKRKK